MHDGKVWKLAEIGRPNFTNGLFEVSLLHANSTDNKLEDYFLVNFPSLYVTLAAHQDEDGTNQMALVHGEKSIGLEINQFSSSNEVLAAIAAYAKVHPGGGLNAEPSNCAVTPDQTIGPFYPHVKNGDGSVNKSNTKPGTKS